MRRRGAWLLLFATMSCGYASHDARAHLATGDRASEDSGTTSSMDVDASSAHERGDHIASSTQDSGSAGHAGPTATAAAGSSASTGGSKIGVEASTMSPDAEDGASTAHDHGDAAAGESAAEPPPPEIWIGELWTMEAMLCGPEGTFPVNHWPEGHSERAVLLLDRDSDPASPTGRIRIGSADQPDAPSPEPNDPQKDLAETGGWSANDSPYWCATSFLSDGTEYSVFESRRSADRLQFSVVPAERWQAWCASQGRMARPCRKLGECESPLELCPCGASGCEPHVGTRLSFDFTIHGDTMETIVQPYETAELRLQRVQ
jgi:hypothetical protein